VAPPAVATSNTRSSPKMVARRCGGVVSCPAGRVTPRPWGAVDSHVTRWSELQLHRVREGGGGARP
jgi:hypothetical protein